MGDASLLFALLVSSKRAHRSRATSGLLSLRQRFKNVRKGTCFMAENIVLIHHRLPVNHRKTREEIIAGYGSPDGNRSGHVRVPVVAFASWMPSFWSSS